jgi:hypothetical protein
MWDADGHVSVLADELAVFSAHMETAGEQKENDK